MRRPGLTELYLSLLSLTLFVLGGLMSACETQPEEPPVAKVAALPERILFDSSRPASETKIDLDDDFPANWSGFQALVLELKASSPQRMNLKVYAGEQDGTPRFSRVLLHPYPQTWIRLAIPVEMLQSPPATGHDMASVGNRSRAGYFVSLWGPFVPLEDVRAIGFEMEKPLGSPTLELRSIQLMQTSPGDAVLESTPLVDVFGQFLGDKWPGKADSLTQLESDWRAEEQTISTGDFGYCSYGGYQKTRARASGFFRVEKIQGKWWFVDPDGHLFLSAGADVIRPEMMTRTRDREHFFQELPPGDLLPDYDRDGDLGASFFTWNLHRRFGPDWKTAWIDLTMRRMDAWGLNTVANWSDSSLWEAGRKPYVIPLRSWPTEVSYLGLPDVYSDQFPVLADQRAEQQCAPRKDDPWLLGYFLANEPPFPQKELQTVQMILDGPETATQTRLKEWLAEEDNPERRKQFIAEALVRFIEVASAAVKKHDANHLNLGMRSGGRPTDAEIEAAAAFDVYSVNIYHYEVSGERVQRIAELTGKPILIGEFHFGTPGRGLAASLVQVADHKQRGVAYRYYVEQAFAMPEMIGTHWFQWADQPCTGRFDGENYNIGLVDVTDRPYQDLVEALKESHRRLAPVHAGEVEPFAVRPVTH